MAYDRFQFEQDILTAWGITTDLHDLTIGVIEHNMTTDQIANVLIGLEALYNLRFERLFAHFEQSIAQPTLPPQEPLGEPFSTILHENLFDLYEGQSK